MIKAGILVLFLILEEKLSILHQYVTRGLVVYGLDYVWVHFSLPSLLRPRFDLFLFPLASV